MTKEEHDRQLQIIQNKLGEEQSSIIADDLGILVTDNEKMNKDYSDLMEKYKKSETRNQQLVEANSNLLRQVASPVDQDNNNFDKSDNENKPPIDIRDAFDNKGNFKK